MDQAFIKTVRLSVSVSQLNINRGEALSSSHCAVALALWDALQKRKRPYWRIQKVQVVQREISLSGEGFEIIMTEVPLKVSQFISRFDDPSTRGECEPFSFTFQGDFYKTA